MVIRDRPHTNKVTCKHAPITDEGFGASWTFCKFCNKEWTKEMEKEWKTQHELPNTRRRDNHR